MSGPPRVTVAIALHRSGRFVDRIARNVENIERGEVEIVISDRHGLDDALDQLRGRLSNDPRVRFRSNHDRCGWVVHYNELLSASAAPYFIWMPHDDEFPRGYVSTLLRELEKDPEAILAYARLDGVYEDGSPAIVLARANARRDEPADPAERATAFLASREYAIAFRGVFRRDRVVHAGVMLPASCPVPDLCWLFALRLLGRFRFTQATGCTKLYHAASATQARRPWRSVLQCADQMRAFADAHAADARARGLLEPAIRKWARRELPSFVAGQLARRLGVPRSWWRRARHLLERVRAARRA